MGILIWPSSLLLLSFRDLNVLLLRWMESSPVLLDAALILPTPTRLGVLIHSEAETREDTRGNVIPWN